MNAKRIFFILLSTIIIFTAMKFPVWRYFEIYPYKWYHKDTYKEPLYAGSWYDRKKVHPIMNQIDKAMSATEYSEVQLETKFKKLSYFSYPDIISELHQLKLLTAHLNKNNGYIWIKYSHIGYDADGQVQYGSAEIYSRLTLKKDINGEWCVTEIREAP